jgi:hypothetical protein
MRCGSSRSISARRPEPLIAPKRKAGEDNFAGLFAGISVWTASGGGVEFLDQPVPDQDHRHQPLPESRIAAARKILERDALLLDPGVIAQIEYALALDARQFKQRIGARARQILAKPRRRERKA